MSEMRSDVLLYYLSIQLEIVPLHSLLLKYAANPECRDVTDGVLPGVFAVIFPYDLFSHDASIR